MASRTAWLPILVLLAAGCSNSSNLANSSNAANPSNPEQIPSCLPPGYRPCPPGSEVPQPTSEPRGEELDVLLAVVEGEVITKRRLAREAGGLAPGQDPSMFERQLHRRLLQRARLLLFVKEAERAGVLVRDPLLDKVVEDHLAQSAKEAAERTGETVTVEAYLADKGITREEFRDHVREQLMFQGYVMKLKEGIGGLGRPQVDMDVSPAEVRRIYWDHPRAFDEKPGVRFAFFQPIVENYLVDDIGVLDAEEKAVADAEAMAQAWRQGVAPEQIASRYELGEREWRAAAEEEFFEENVGVVRLFGEQANAWLFDPARSPGEATVLYESSGPVVFGILERREGRHVPYEEAHDKIVLLVQGVRTQRLIEEKLIEILSSRNAVQPSGLAAELLAGARHRISEIDSDPIAAAARFR